jgi:hypothetical protein
MTEKYRGNEVEYDNEIELWVYSDTKKTVRDNWEEVPCGNCGKNYTKEGHDGCLGTLIGVMNACCGHGDGEPSVQFLDGKCIFGEDAKAILDILKRNS